jgi:D-sedoheptulose 7-phosphate isomerase
LKLIQEYFNSYIDDLKETLNGINPAEVEQVVNALLIAHKNNRQVFIIGNGGSAATASHFACDLAKGTVNYPDKNFMRFRASSLTDNVAILTAIGNDMSYEDVFTEQLKNYLNKDDLLLVISASGNSPNLIRAIEYARSQGALIISFLGFGGGKAKQLSDINLMVPNKNYGIAEDFHMIIEHVITQIIRRTLASDIRKVVFMDRDGIINKKPTVHRYVTRWEEFVFNEEIFPLLKHLQKKGYRLVVITNQQGVGKGEYSEETLEEIHQKMLTRLKEEQITIDRIEYCPHLADAGCFCRKPKSGMFKKAMNNLTYTIDIKNSYFLGDSCSDVQAGKEFGVMTILVAPGTKDESVKPDFVVDQLADVKKIFQ